MLPQGHQRTGMVRPRDLEHTVHTAGNQHRDQRETA